MKKVNFIVFIIVIHFVTYVYSFTPHNVAQFINKNDWSFIENKGQLIAPIYQKATKESDIAQVVKFYSHSGRVQIYCSPGMISFVINKDQEVSKISEATGLITGLSSLGNIERLGIETCTQKKNAAIQIDLELINANPNSIILPSDEQNYYENFYICNSARQDITNLHSFKTITYKEIYPHIDMILHCKEGGMKYEFMVYPGGKVNDIQMSWNGLKTIKQLGNDGLSYSVGFWHMEEERPVSYQDGKEIKSSFLNIGKRIGFKVASFDKTKRLVIDPTLIWGSYYGGNGLDMDNSVVSDKDGNVYITGYTTSKSGIATKGAYMTSLRGTGGFGSGDAFIAKFNYLGAIQWATYLGGDSGTVASSIAIDQNSNIYITGFTKTKSGIATAGAYQTTNNGNGDAFLAKFDNNGSMVWATYYGGKNVDYGYGVATDPNGYIYITGHTQSNSDIATKGASQDYFASNKSGGDAFLAKFSASGKIQWSTYFGGPDDDGGWNVATDGSNVYIDGRTASSSGIASAGSYQASYSGNEDAFLAKYSNAGSLLWATYYGGNFLDIALGLDVDKTGSIFITGYSASNSGIATKGAFQTLLEGSFNAFLAKFKPNGMIQWATYFGGSGNTYGECLVTDYLGNTYIAGYTSSRSGIATKGAYQTSLIGNDNVFLGKFMSNGTLAWASYYGSGNLNYAAGITIDASNNLYITGETNSVGPGIATGGSYQTFYGGGAGDAFLARFNFKSGVDAGIYKFTTPRDSFCPGIQFVNVQLENFGHLVLDSAEINWTINGNMQKAVHWKGKIQPDSSISVLLGQFLTASKIEAIRAWTIKPNGIFDSVPENDSAKIIGYLSDLPKATAGPDTTLCYNQTYTMRGAGGINYLWTPAKYLSNDTIPDPKANLPRTQLYTLVVSNQTGCTDTAQVLLKVRPPLRVKLSTAKNRVCCGMTTTLTASPQGGDSNNYIFTWPADSQSGNIITLKPVSSRWHMVILSDNCTPVNASDSIYIEVIPPAKSSFDWTPKTFIKQKKPVQFINTSSNSNSYLWQFGNHTDSSQKQSPAYIYTDTGNYKVMLIAYGIDGCANDTAISYIKVIDGTVAVYIPNVFTPNGDGHNDRFEISGTGIKAFEYSIYNRWGELIFDATSTSVKSALGDLGAWDGTFKGAPVPEGVYIFTATITDIDEHKHYFNGNVTVAR
jgi:gliding motility-associated-like protein